MSAGVITLCLLVFQCAGFGTGLLDGDLKIAGIFEIIQLHQAAFTYSNNIYTYGKHPTDIAVSHIVDSSIVKDEPFTALRGTCLFLKQGIVGLFGPQSSLNLEIVQSITERKNIPHFLTRWVNPSQMGRKTINLFPHPSILADAFLEILMAMEWESFTILYTNSEHLLKISDFIAEAKEWGILVYVENVDPSSTGNYRTVLRNAGRSGQKNFILDCPIEDLKTLLTQIQEVGLLTDGYHYFLTNLDAHTEYLDKYMFSDAVVTGVHFPRPPPDVEVRTSKELCIIYNATFKQGCGTPELDIETGLILDAVRIFLDTMKEEAIVQGQILSCDSDDSWNYGADIINTIKLGTYEGLTGQIRFGDDGFRNAFELTIYQIRRGVVLERGSWNTTYGIGEHVVLNFDEEEVNKDEEDEELRNRNLNVLITLTEPYVRLRESTKRLTGNNRFEGFAIDLIEEIARIVGFQYTFHLRTDNQHGQFDSLSGKWTGMIGDIIEGKADLAVSDLTINKDRVDPVEFTQPFMGLGVSILFRKPSVVAPSFFYFAQPFSISFWQYLGISYLIIVCSLFLIGRLSPNEWQRPETCKQSKKYLENDLTLLNCLWFVSAAVFRQTTNVKMYSISARVISATWWLFCFVLLAMYISFSLSRNAIEEKEKLFENVAELLEYAEANDIKFGAKKGGATEAFFKNSKNVYYQQVAEYMNIHPEDMPATTGEGVQRAMQGDYAFFMESATIEYTIRRQCNLTSYGGLLDQKGFGIAVKKGSPLLTHLNKAIIKLQSSGDLNMLKRKWWDEKYAGDACDDDTGSDIAPKTVDHVNGLIAITFAGIAIALVMALLEFMVHVYQLSKKVKQPYGKAFSEELKKSFKRKHTVQNVEAIALTKTENGNNSQNNKEEA